MIAATRGDTSAPEGEALPTTVILRHQDDALTIQSRESIDLDAPLSDPLWSDGDGNRDLIFYEGELRPSSRAGLRVVPTGESATYSTCNRSGFGAVTLSIREAAPAGDFFCVRTSAGRIVGAKIIAITDESVVLSARVWSTNG